MRVETQLSVFLENKAGVLANVLADLARHGIAIRALTISSFMLAAAMLPPMPSRDR